MSDIEKPTDHAPQMPRVIERRPEELEDTRAYLRQLTTRNLVEMYVTLSHEIDYQCLPRYGEGVTVKEGDVAVFYGNRTRNSMKMLIREVLAVRDGIYTQSYLDAIANSAEPSQKIIQAGETSPVHQLPGDNKSLP